jgi:hypothetical protein
VIAIAIVVVLVATALIYVLAPVAKPAGRDAPGAGGGNEAAARKKTAVDALFDLAEERAAGKLSDADYNLLKHEYELELLSALEDLDSLGENDDAIESEIAAMRARLECPNCGALKKPEGPCERCGH